MQTFLICNLVNVILGLVEITLTFQTGKELIKLVIISGYYLTLFFQRYDHVLDWCTPCICFFNFFKTSESLVVMPRVFWAYNTLHRNASVMDTK